MHCADGIAALDPPPSWSEKELWRAGPHQMNTSDGRLDNRERLGEDLNHGVIVSYGSVSRKRFVSGRSGGGSTSKGLIGGPWRMSASGPNVHARHCFRRPQRFRIRCRGASSLSRSDNFLPYAREHGFVTNARKPFAAASPRDSRESRQCCSMADFSEHAPKPLYNSGRFSVCADLFVFFRLTRNQGRPDSYSSHDVKNVDDC